MCYKIISAPSIEAVNCKQFRREKSNGITRRFHVRSFGSPSRRNKSYTRACPVFKANFESRALLKICTVLYIRPLHISHITPYLPPPPPPQFCISFVFHFSWALQPSQEKLKTTLMQNFGGVGGDMRCIMGDAQVAYGLKEAWASTN